MPAAHPKIALGTAAAGLTLGCVAAEDTDPRRGGRYAMLLALSRLAGAAQLTVVCGSAAAGRVSGGSSVLQKAVVGDRFARTTRAVAACSAAVCSH